MSDLIILDTNVYVNHYMGYPPLKELFTKLLLDHKYFGMPAVVAMELMWYEKISLDVEQRRARQAYIDGGDYFLDVTKEIALLAAEIRRGWQLETGKKIKHGDVLIAATAIVNQATLYSNNDRDFSFIKAEWGLQYINPIESQIDLQIFLSGL